MSEIFELEAQLRGTHGTAHSRRLRRNENLVPAVIYGEKRDATSIALSHNLVKRALENEAFFSHILTIKMTGGETEQVVAKAVQRHPYKPSILHMDFLRINANEKLYMHIPLHFLNETNAPGVRDGGVVNHHLTEVEIACLPAYLPEYIEVDLAKLHIGESVHLIDLKLPANVELVALVAEEPQNLSVASIHAPRVEKESDENAVIETVIIGEQKADGDSEN